MTARTYCDDSRHASEHPAAARCSFFFVLRYICSIGRPPSNPSTFAAEIPDHRSLCCFLFCSYKTGGGSKQYYSNKKTI